MSELTVVERILVAAASLGGQGESFSAEDLVVRCWELFPDYFGLQGYAKKYPDSNRVLTKIMGAKGGLRGKGWISKTGSKRYRLTEVGVVRAQELGNRNEGKEGTRVATLNRGLLSTLKRMLDSTAKAKFDAGQDLSFGDASSFWNISSRTTAAQFKRRTEEATLAISAALKEAAERGGTFTLPGYSLPVRDADIRALEALSEHLAEIFAKEIAVIASRTDERRL